jgi:hypothetical protein
MPRSARFAAVSLAVLVLLAILAAAFGKPAFEALLEWRYQPTPRPTKFATPRDRAEAVRQDLEALAQLPDLDRSFSPADRARFDVERGKALAAAGTLTPHALEMEVSRLVALAGNGHTTVGRRLRRLPRVPLRVMWFEEGLHVVRTDAANAALLGARVESINGRTPAELLAGLVPYVSGTVEHARASAPFFLESPFALAGVWRDMDPARATFVLRATDGKAVTRTLDAIAPDPASPYVDPTRNLAPQRMRSEKAPWANLLADRADLPLALREPDSSLYVRRLDGDGLYIHIASVTDDERGDLEEQLAALLAALKPGALRYAVLDMRFDGGGNYFKTLDFTRGLPGRIAGDGRLFILTDNATFSAALVTTARAKHFAGARATVVGERVGDRERFWAESGKPIELPHSRILVFFATGYHDWQTGCGLADLTRCFLPNYPYDVPAGSLAPDRGIAWKFADYRRGVDTVMEEVVRMAAPSK